MKILKGSTDEAKLREYYVKLIEFSTILSFEAVNMNMKELDALKYLETKPVMPTPPPEEVMIG